MKIDIFSGFLGAGKTTLIKKLLKEAYAGEKVVLIENEFGDIGIDGGFLEEVGVKITEMNSGCICCSLVGDFSKALQKVATEYAPDRILIEPSGVGKLSDVRKAVETSGVEGVLNAACTVVDASKCKMYAKNFGEFFLDQIQSASCILFSHTDKAGEEKLRTAVEIVKEKNPNATLVTSSWEGLDGKDILAAMEKKNSLQAELESLEQELHEHHHEEECNDPDCHCHHHHEHGERDHGCHEHHHEHHHEHECHDPDCHCHEHHHEHGHHHADEVFTSWGKETTRRYAKEELERILNELNGGEYGQILRAKGIVAGEREWLHFDYIPQESDVRVGKAGITGRLCVIGCHLNEEKLEQLFGV